MLLLPLLQQDPSPALTTQAAHASTPALMGREIRKACSRRPTQRRLEGSSGVPAVGRAMRVGDGGGGEEEGEEGMAGQQGSAHTQAGLHAQPAAAIDARLACSPRLVHPRPPSSHASPIRPYTHP